MHTGRSTHSRVHKALAGRLLTAALVCAAHALVIALLAIGWGHPPVTSVTSVVPVTSAAPPTKQQAVRVHWVHTPPPPLLQPLPTQLPKQSPKQSPKQLPKQLPKRPPQSFTKPQPAPPEHHIVNLLTAPAPVPIPAAATAAVATVATTATTAPEPPATPDRVSTGVHYLHNPAPRYPRTARRNRAQGRVLLRVQVGPDGIPLQIEVQQSSGHLVLDQAALHAVRQWIFGAARDGTEAHGAWVVVPLIFSLKENK